MGSATLYQGAVGSYRCCFLARLSLLSVFISIELIKRNLLLRSRFMTFLITCLVRVNEPEQTLYFAAYQLEHDVYTSLPTIAEHLFTRSQTEFIM